MSTIAAAVYDVIEALPGRACSMQDVIKALPDIDHESVISAVHRLSEKGVLRMHRGFGAGGVLHDRVRSNAADRWPRPATQEPTIDAPA